MIAIYREINLFILILLLFFVFQHGRANANSGLSDEQKLIEKIQEYYDFEKAGDWERTYSFRTPLYRKSVPVELYKGKMVRDNAGWKL